MSCVRAATATQFRRGGEGRQKIDSRPKDIVTGMLGIATVTGAGQKDEIRPPKGVTGERISAPAGSSLCAYACVSVIRKSTKRFCQSNFVNLRGRV